jgi:hypothetical protein
MTSPGFKTHCRMRWPFTMVPPVELRSKDIITTIETDLSVGPRDPGSLKNQIVLGPATQVNHHQILNGKELSAIHHEISRMRLPLPPHYFEEAATPQSYPVECGRHQFR